MKKSKPLDTAISLLNFQTAGKKITKAENFGSKSAFHKLQKIIFRPPLRIPSSYSEQKDIISYITSRNMRKTLTPSRFKNVLTEPEGNALNVKTILQLISQSLKKYKQLISFPSAVNVLAFHTKNYLLGNLISEESEGNVVKSTEEDHPDNWGGPESYKLIKFLKDDFNDVIKNTSAVIVLFYANWCRHCLKLKSPYGKAAVMAKEAGLNILFAAFDVTINPDLADEKGVVGIPILKYYKDGKFVINYKGPRTSDDLFAFLKNPPEPPEEGKPPSI